MSNTRIPCSNPECRHTILPATAAAYGGLCAPCFGQRKKQERDEYIRLNRKTVDLYAGVDDVVERIRIMLSDRKYDPLIEYVPPPITEEETFASLDAGEAARVADMAHDAMIRGQTDLAEEVGKRLAIHTELNLDAMLDAWLVQNHFFPPIVFRSAGPGIRDEVIAAVSAGVANANLAISALAWIGDDVVQKVFLEWETDRPAWVERLHVGPLQYAHEAGWELVHGARRDLFHASCLAVKPCPEGEGRPHDHDIPDHSSELPVVFTAIGAYD